MKEDNREKITLWLQPDILRRVDSWLEEDNCKTRREFVEKGDGAAVVLFDERDGFFYIEIFHLSRGSGFRLGGAADQTVEKQVQMSDLENGGLARIVDDGHELVPDERRVLSLF